jgi:single-strand DNA-binding protein
MVQAGRERPIGTFRTRTWHDQDGVERSRLEIVADEIGPSLRWATAQIAKTGTASG